LLVVVTGPPGAGKTTIAEQLRNRLSLPLLAKDTFKETLGEQLGVTARAASHRLGTAVFELLRVVVHELLRNGVSLIVEANFTPRAGLFTALPPCRIAQVHVAASPATLRSRLLNRSSDRHPVHYDREVASEIADRAAAGEWDPLRLSGVLVRIDTTHGFPADVASLLTDALARSSVTLF
jgi:predicted kinase